MTWPTKKLGEVCDIVKSGITPFDGEKEYIDTNSVQNFSIVKQQIIIYKKRPSRANMEAKANDVLVAKMKDTVKVYLATLEDEKKRIFSTGFFVLRPKKDLVRPKFLFLYCSSDIFQNLKDELARGSTQKAINDEKLKKYFEIPFPPLEIQKQIVARIEELFEKIDKAIKLRKDAQRDTESIVPSALYQIFEVSLKSKIKSQKSKTQIKIQKLKEIAEVVMGQSPPSDTYNNHGVGLPFYQGKVDFGETYINEPQTWCSKPAKIALKNDVLISVRAPVGPTNLCKEKSCIGRGLAAIRPRKILDNLYLFYWFRYKEPEIVNLGQGSTFGAIRKDYLENLEIPRPLLPEQKKIVVELDDLREKVEKLKKIQKEQLKDLEELKKSILDKAFKGELI